MRRTVSPEACLGLMRTVQDAAGVDRLRQIEAGRADLRLVRRRLAAALCRRAAVPECRRQGSQHPHARRCRFLHRAARRPRRRHTDGIADGAALQQERQIHRAQRRRGQTQRALPAGADPARARPSQRDRRRRVRLHGTSNDAARDRRQTSSRGTARARRSRGQGQAERARPRSARRHCGRVRPVHRR